MDLRDDRKGWKDVAASRGPVPHRHRTAVTSEA
jgi:hypothetical protein